jgi:hypothetical protein
MMIKEHVISKRLATRMCIPTEDLVNWTPVAGIILVHEWGRRNNQA